MEALCPVYSFLAVSYFLQTYFITFSSFLDLKIVCFAIFKMSLLKLQDFISALRRLETAFLWSLILCMFHLKPFTDYEDSHIFITASRHLYYLSVIILLYVEEYQEKIKKKKILHLYFYMSNKPVKSAPQIKRTLAHPWRSLVFLLPAIVPSGISTILIPNNFSHCLIFDKKELHNLYPFMTGFLLVMLCIWYLSTLLCWIDFTQLLYTKLYEYTSVILI